jgi:hypothetical protein
LVLGEFEALALKALGRIRARRRSRRRFSSWRCVPREVSDALRVGRALRAACSWSTRCSVTADARAKLREFGL